MAETAARAGLFVFKQLAHLPISMIRLLSIPIGQLVYWLAAPRRHITLTNLRLCFPQWSEARRRRVARAHFRAFVTTFFERFIFWFGPRSRIESLCEVQGQEHLAAVDGRPVILLAPHFLGLDAGGIRLQLDGRTDSMYAQQKSAVLTQAMTEGRTRFNGAQMILRNEGMRGVVRSLKAKVPFYFLPDMDLGARDAVFVPFFNVPAATVTSVARLARLTGAAVVPCVTVMTPGGYKLTIYPAWQDYPPKDLEQATRLMNAFIEERVLEAPEQYLWSHKRFKTRPEGQAGVY